MLLYKKTKKKRPAFMLVSALLATLILMMIAHGFMLMYGGQFTYLQAAKTASEGQQYAELVGEKVKLEGIDAEEVTSKTNLDTLTGNDKDKDWQYTYEISDGTEDDNGNIFKVATIKIYKDGENSPRYTYEVPLSSLGELQGDAIRNITGNFNATDNNSWNINANGVFYGQTIGAGDQGGEAGEYKKYYFDTSRVVPTAEENRPINKAVRYFIKAK